MNINLNYSFSLQLRKANERQSKLYVSAENVSGFAMPAATYVACLAFKKPTSGNFNVDRSSLMNLIYILSLALSWYK